MLSGVTQVFTERFVSCFYDILVSLDRGSGYLGKAACILRLSLKMNNLTVLCCCFPLLSTKQISLSGMNVFQSTNIDWLQCDVCDALRP